MNSSKTVWQDWVSRAFLAPIILVFTRISLRFLINPEHATGTQGLLIQSAQTMTHMRVMSVFIIGCAIALVYCVSSVKRLRLGFIFLAILLPLAIAVRAYGVYLDGTSLADEMRLFVLETIFFALSLVGIALQSSKERARQ